MDTQHHCHDLWGPCPALAARGPKSTEGAPPLTSLPSGDSSRDARAQPAFPGTSHPPELVTTEAPGHHPQSAFAFEKGEQSTLLQNHASSSLLQTSLSFTCKRGHQPSRPGWGVQQDPGLKASRDQGLCGASGAAGAPQHCLGLPAPPPLTPRPGRGRAAPRPHSQQRRQPVPKPRPGLASPPPCVALF